MAPVVIRPSRRDDHAAIRAVVVAAFDGTAEAELVERLRAEGATRCELVAEFNGAIFGHVLFFDLALEAQTAPNPQLAGLAPLAVRPGQQRQGIGSLLVREGLAQCAALGCDGVVVLGDPAYYRRFGFRAALAAGLDSPWSGSALQAVELRPGAMAGRSGRLTYPKAFDAL